MTFTLVLGKRIRKWGGWYRHDEILKDGVKLEGHIQVRTNGRGGLESLTGFRNACVLGTDVAWLDRMNERAKIEPDLFKETNNG